MIRGDGGVSEFHREVVNVILPVLAGNGFALAGGNALRLHGITRRPTMDVNFFTPREDVIPGITGAVESALRKAGFHVERLDVGSAVLEYFPDAANYHAEWTVARDGKQVILQIHGGERRAHPPVTMDIGPVLAEEDALASKVNALTSRYEARDYIDVAAALDRYSPEELIRMAWSREPGHQTDEFTDIGPALDQMDDAEFAWYGLTSADIAELRRRFAAWPRQGSAS